MEPQFESMEALERAAVVIDCTPSGVGIANKNEFYSKFTHNTLGFIAQGSEFGFGKPIRTGRAFRHDEPANLRAAVPYLDLGIRRDMHAEFA